MINCLSPGQSPVSARADCPKCPILAPVLRLFTIRRVRVLVTLLILVPALLILVDWENDPDLVFARQHPDYGYNGRIGPMRRKVWGRTYSG
ncbi:hypothetical protein KIPB_010466 [Kipferlia bialata]|uniref:Uncharacterized protein n=1 Tax=Kipferlia bialata TaxID=797122 RepID=A0A9K3GMZ2_9EUKA|nr:hypothetical protein KIPB_010466 [Kipferlia bialata]|eukprot:g10466.t1